MWLGHTTIGLRCDNEPSCLSLLEAVRKTCRALGISVIVETVVPGSHQSNGGAESTVNILRQHASLLVNQIEQSLELPDVIGCQHPICMWALLHASWLHNRFAVRQGQTAYERCCDRMYTGRLCMFGETVFGYLKTSLKGAPRWTKGVWLGKTQSNDCHILSTPGSKLFVTRSVRRRVKPFDADMISQVECVPWDFGYASLGSQLILAKRIAAPTALPVLPSFDADAEAVRDVPSTPDEPAPVPRRSVVDEETELVLGIPPTPDEQVLESSEVGPHANVSGPVLVGSSAPVTSPVGPDSGDVSMSVEAGPSAGIAVPPVSSQASSSFAASHTHRRSLAEDDVDHPSKLPRLLAVHELEHKDETIEWYFESDELEMLETYEDEFHELQTAPVLEPSNGVDPECMSAEEVASALVELSVPYTPFEPELSDEALLALDILADKVELSRLKSLGVLLKTETLGDVTPKRLTTRFVRTWRDKRLSGKRVWLRRSRYVAREYAWLTPEREDLFSPASSSLTTRVLPTLYLKWRSQGYVLVALDVADAFLTAPQQTPSGQSCEYALGKVLPGQRDGSQLWYESITELLHRDLGIEPCPAYPRLLKSSCGRCVMLLHVDDILCLVHEDFLKKRLLPTFEARYKVAVEIMKEPDDEICFLKRTHVLKSEFEMVIQGHPKHLEHLFEILKIGHHLKPKKVPGHPNLGDR